MNDKGTGFPQYRKLSNDKVYYQIVNDRCFNEIQLIGEKARLHKIEAKQFPEILKIIDLLALSIEGYELSTEVEFNEIRAKYKLEIGD